MSPNTIWLLVAGWMLINVLFVVIACCIVKRKDRNPKGEER